MNIRSYQLQSSKYIAEFLGPIINFYELYEWCDQTFGPRGDGQRWQDRKSTRLNSSHSGESRMPSSA